LAAIAGLSAAWVARVTLGRLHASRPSVTYVHT
jgi:hypothetical protein